VIASEGVPQSFDSCCAFTLPELSGPISGGRPSVDRPDMTSVFRDLGCDVGIRVVRLAVDLGLDVGVRAVRLAVVIVIG